MLAHIYKAYRVSSPVLKQYKSALFGAGLSLLFFFVASVVKIELGFSGLVNFAIQSSTAVWKLAVLIIAIAILIIFLIAELVEKKTVYTAISSLSATLGGVLGASFTVYCIAAWSDPNKGNELLGGISIVLAVVVIIPIVVEIIHHNTNINSKGERALAIVSCIAMVIFALAFIPWKPF